jgi:hypothetical protein
MPEQLMFRHIITMDRDLNVAYNLLNVRKEFVRLAHLQVTPVDKK